MSGQRTIARVSVMLEVSVDLGDREFLRSCTASDLANDAAQSALNTISRKSFGSDVTVSGTPKVVLVMVPVEVTE